MWPKGADQLISSDYEILKDTGHYLSCFRYLSIRHRTLKTLNYHLVRSFTQSHVRNPIHSFDENLKVCHSVQWKLAELCPYARVRVNLIA